MKSQKKYKYLKLGSIRTKGYEFKSRLGKKWFKGHKLLVGCKITKKNLETSIYRIPVVR